MKKFLFFLLTLVPLLGLAQSLPSSGYYRVQNKKTQRYISIVDTHASVSSDGNNVDLEAILMLEGFDDKVSFNPATICYVQNEGGNQYNILGQGLDLSSSFGGRYVNVSAVGDGSYRLFASAAGMARYLSDNKLMADYPIIDGTNRNWYVLSVDLSENYFGIKPDVTATADNSCWSTLYAGFPLKPADTDTKMYRVGKVDYSRSVAVIYEIKTGLPGCYPVLIRCGATTPKENMIELLDPSYNPEIDGNNYLIGNWYCNDVENTETRQHRNVTPYFPSTMRMLGLNSEGKAAFVKSDINYLPANKCYLAVDENYAPDELTIVTEEEYQKMITGIEETTLPVTVSSKVIYDLQGRRVTEPSKGLYIVNGKKVVIK